MIGNFMGAKVRIEEHKTYAIIWMEDEERHNMLTRDFMKELSKAVAQVAGNPRMRGMILTSAASVFCAGASVEEMYPLNREEADRFGKIGRNLNRAIENLKMISVAAVGGLCAGGGNELAISCMYRIASVRARFSQPEVSLGIIPGAGGCYRLPRLIGVGRAKELLYTGEMINARYAQRIGLVDQVVRPEELLHEARRFLEARIRDQDMRVT